MNSTTPFTRRDSPMPDSISASAAAFPNDGQVRAQGALCQAASTGLTVRVDRGLHVPVR